jgi:hypothetical protein
MRLISEALTNAKRRRAYVEDRLEHTKREEWKQELEHINYTIKFLRGQINVKSKPISQAKTSVGPV